MPSQKPIRILHVLGGMVRGGIETWLMHMLRNIDRQRFRMDFLTHTEEHCAHDDEVRSLGSRIISCLHPRRPLQYARRFRRVLRQYGPYDVVHSHVHHYSGYVLRFVHRRLEQYPLNEQVRKLPCPTCHSSPALRRVAV